MGMPRKQPMPPGEKAICHRLREFRLKTELSQAQFAAITGQNFLAYQGFEYGRTQLNYPAAWKILKFFNMLSPLWLADGSGPMIEPKNVGLPDPEEIEEGQRTPFSRVFARYSRQEFIAAKPLRIINSGLPVHLFGFPATAQGRLNNIERFGDLLFAWLAGMPDAKVSDFLDELFLRGAQIVARYPRDTDKQAVAARKEEMRQIVAERRFPGENLEGSKDISKTSLTIVSDNVNINLVKPQMPDFLERLRKATAERGQKTALADFLKVPLARVSQWLSGERDPDGENTLRLLKWVQRQERK